MISNSAIEIDDLAIWFGGKSILSDFGLHLRTGEKVTLTGPSGSGKSSILHCLLGFIVPARGTIRIADDVLNPDSIWKLRRRMAYVPQEPAFLPGKVDELLARPFTFRANAKLRLDPLKRDALFERFLLPTDLRDKDIGLLSGGERQRLAVVSALLLEREILLLDEASSALDETSRGAVAEYLRSREDLTMLSVSHHPEGFALSDRVVHVTEGEAA